MPKFPFQRQKQPTQSFIEDLGNGLGLEMIQIPTGTFLMGSPEGELKRHDNEGPQHSVTVPPFLMGRYPVTQEQWRAIARLPVVNRAIKPDPSSFKGVGEASWAKNRHPVNQVSWYHAVEWCDRLSRYTKRTYRLPTEAEWEYACRAGTTTPFYFGETITTQLANYRGTDHQNGAWSSSGSYGSGPKGEYRQTTTPVDHFGIANAFGLCEMHGNVLEWCLDHWHENYEGAPIDGTAWVTGGESDFRVNRGGCWHFTPSGCRSAYRCYGSPGGILRFDGFRVVCEVPKTLQ
ncbi:formylglycine-generating enzyme family protein [Leptolyngbya sp. AN02str]|uniref:formylglycine-generating enzyme family protein n=1 Tax=Leptolyngbya sp. AN02str TaxID=3423363 RepID=UPI003D317C45